MSKEPPERLTISIPSDHDLDLELVDQLVEQADAESRSEAIREALLAFDPAEE